MRTADTIVDIKKNIILAAYRSQEGHIASSFSILDILYVLYQDILNVDPNDPNKPDRDRFVLSKGHASLGYYAILEAFGFLRADELDTFCAYHSRLGGHPDINKVPGVEVSAGSLGHGLPMAVGIAMALKIQKNPARVFCLVGDGELNEGSMWESFLLAAHHHLSNLTCIVDYNHSTDRAVDISDLSAKLRAFNWETLEVNGHSHDALRLALQTKSENQPVAIIANTIKGNGCARMENNPEWHHKSPNEEQLKEILEGLT
jgi:transketolase